MPGIVRDEIIEEGVGSELIGNSTPYKENSVSNKSSNSPLSPQSVCHDLPDAGVVDTSIEQLYENLCDMQSSDQSLSRRSFGSDGEESRIDSELRHLVGGEMKEVKIMEEETEEVEKPHDDFHSDSTSKKGSSSADKQKEKILVDKPLIDKRNGMKKPNAGITPVKKQRNLPLGGSKLHNGTVDSSESGSENPDMGPYLLKQARDLILSGDNHQKALELALRAAKAFEACANGRPSLELVMCLHLTSAIYCSLGQYSEAIPVLEQSIKISMIDEGQEHALAKYAGHMQLGDTYAMLGQLENSVMCYTTGLEVQKQVLGETDPSVGQTCRYLAEAHVQALQFDEAARLCQMALDIHKENGSPASLEEAADRRLMGIICEAKGDHEAALEHLVLASMAMAAKGLEVDVASADCSIGDTYLSLSRYDEALFAYQKSLTFYKTSKGENHPAVGSVFVRLANLYNKTGKLKEANSYCENALRIYENPMPQIPLEEIASGLTDLSAIYESMNELEQAINLLQKALNIYNDAPGQQSTIAGIEAQMGVTYYMLGNYSESYSSFKNAISKLRASGEKKSAFFGIALNQMGLACVQRYAINEAADLFEEAKSILEQEYGPYHPDTLGVYSNLAGTYDAIGRLDDAIELLEYVVGTREEKLGTANPDVDDEKRRLAELLKEAGKARSRKGISLENLLDANSQGMHKNGIKV